MEHQCEICFSKPSPIVGRDFEPYLKSASQRNASQRVGQGKKVLETTTTITTAIRQKRTWHLISFNQLLKIWSFYVILNQKDQVRFQAGQDRRANWEILNPLSFQLPDLRVTCKLNLATQNGSKWGVLRLDFLWNLDYPNDPNIFQKRLFSSPSLRLPGLCQSLGMRQETSGESQNHRSNTQKNTEVYTSLSLHRPLQ